MKNKLFSILISIVVCSGTICSSFVVRAEENQYATGSLPIPGEDFYTLSQLFEMSDEEFLALENAVFYYEDIKNDAESYEFFYGFEEYGGISGILRRVIGSSNNEYVANETEQQIETLLGDDIDYIITSPISIEPGSILYDRMLTVCFPDLMLDAKYDNITDEQIMTMAKYCYCVNQVLTIYYEKCDTFYAVESEQVIKGDINFDKAVNISDALYIVKSQMNLIELTDAQCVIADMNDDDIVDQLDTYILVDSVIESDSFESV